MARPRLLAPIFRLKHHRNGTWYVHWTDERGESRQASLGTTDEAKARELLGSFHPPTQTRWKHRPTGSVYALASDANALVKIGVCSGPVANRMANMQTGSPVKLRIAAEWRFASFEAAHHMERVLHLMFASCRAHGEWFTTTVEDINAALKKLTPLEDAA